MVYLNSKYKMKKMKNIRSVFLKIPHISTVAITIVYLGSFLAPTLVGALTSQQLQQQINELSYANSLSQGSVNNLRVQAVSYEDAISKLQLQIDAVQGAINANIAKQADLQNKITIAEAELAKQKLVLGENIKAMYLEGQISTLEMLASSKDLSEFVDKQQYRNSVKDKITATVAQITKLKYELNAQKDEVELLLKTQQEQQAKLDGDRSEQSRLLSLNRDEQGQYNNKIKANNSNIASLRAQQAAINSSSSSRVYVDGSERGGNCDNGSGNGGYSQASGPAGDACNSPAFSIPDWSGIIDNRWCTSYAYWYFKRVLGRPLYVSGDARDWAYTSSIPISSNPEVGAIGINTRGTYGHVVIVQAIGPTSWGGVNVPEGKILISDMNGNWTGHFGYAIYSVGSLVYINP